MLRSWKAAPGISGAEHHVHSSTEGSVGRAKALKWFVSQVGQNRRRAFLL